MFEFHLGFLDVLVHVADLVKESEQGHVDLLRDVSYIQTEIDKSGRVLFELASRNVEDALFMEVVHRHVRDFFHVDVNTNFFAQECWSFGWDVQVELVSRSFFTLEFWSCTNNNF